MMTNEQDPKMLNIPVTGIGSNKPSILKEGKKEFDKMEKALHGNEPIFGSTADIDDAVDKEV